MEKPKKEEKLKLNKITITIIIVNVVVVILLFYSLIAGTLSKDFATFFWINIRNKYNDIMFLTFENIPLIAKNIYTISLGLIIALALANKFIKKSKISIKTKNRYFNILVSVLVIYTQIIFVMPTMINTIDNINNNIELYNKDKNKKQYKEEDIVNLNKYLQNKVLVLADTINRNSEDTLNEKEIIQISTNDLLNISDKYKFLKGAYPHQYLDISKYNYNDDDYETLGMTENYIVEIDESYSKINKINTVTHEFCHVKGVYHESGAVFCSFIAGINSSNELSEYSAYLEAFNRVNSALYEINEKQAEALEDPVTSLCLTKGYKEICETYSKELNKHIEDTDEIVIETYKLKNYKNYIQDLSKVLTQLESEYKAKFYINDKQITMSQLTQEINNSSNSSLIINTAIDDDNFENISKILKENKNLFLSIYQDYKNGEEEASMSREEAIDYYLKPFETNNIVLWLMDEDEYTNEYDYNRVVRMLLEYYY